MVVMNSPHWYPLDGLTSPFGLHLLLKYWHCQLLDTQNLGDLNALLLLQLLNQTIDPTESHGNDPHEDVHIPSVSASSLSSDQTLTRLLQHDVDPSVSYTIDQAFFEEDLAHWKKSPFDLLVRYLLVRYLLVLLHHYSLQIDHNRFVLNVERHSRHLG